MRVVVLFCYPGDPPMTGELLFGASFKALVPTRGIKVTDWDGGETLYDSGPIDAVVCDLCNAEIGDADPCFLLGTYLYCWRCTDDKRKHFREVVAVKGAER